MPKKVFDEEGNEIMLPFDNVEEFTTLQADKQRLTEELDKRNQTEISFKKLKDMTEEEKQKITAEKIREMQRSEKLEEELGSVKTYLKQSWTDSTLKELGVNDVETKEKIMKMVKVISDDEELGINSDTEAGLKKKLELAYNASGARKSIDPIFGSNSSSASSPVVPSIKWEDNNAFEALSDQLLGKKATQTK